MSRKNKHRTMQSPDMFIPEARQTFSVETGERLDDLQYRFESEQPEPIPPLNEIFTQQLTLF